MYQVSVLAYDGVFASALTGVMDLLNLTGVTWNRIHGEPLNRQFKVQVVSRGGEPVRCTAGMRIAVDTALVERFGVRRTQTDFWTHFHAPLRYMEAHEPTQAGILDLNRYLNL